MKRISIEVTEQESQRLKAMAALQGKSIKEFVLSRTIGEANDEEELALRELEELLDRRLQRAETEGYSTRTVEDIFQEAIDKAAPSPGPDA